MNGFYGFRAGGCNPYSRSAIDVLKLIANLFLQTLQRGCSGRVLRVDQHGSAEIAAREHLRNVPQMASNLIDALSVLRIIRPNLDESTIVPEQEVMCRFLMRESHDVIAMRVDGSVVIRILGMA